MNFLKEILFSFPILKFKINQKSMEPTLKEGDNVLVNRLFYFFRKPKIDDIIVLKYPKNNMYLIKRVKKVDNNKYFVLGDNLKESIDSRDFGWISKKEIIGKVWF